MNSKNVGSNFFKSQSSIERNQTYVKNHIKFFKNVLVPSKLLKKHREHAKACKKAPNPCKFVAHHRSHAKTFHSHENPAKLIKKPTNCPNTPHNPKSKKTVQNGEICLLFFPTFSNFAESRGKNAKFPEHPIQHAPYTLLTRSLHARFSIFLTFW